MYDQEKVNEELRKPLGDSQMCVKMADQFRKWLKASSDKMSPLWDKWDRQNMVYRGYRVPDSEDMRAAENKEPVKLIIPITFAQVQTATAFIFSTFAQKNLIYELQGMSPEDTQYAAALETDLDYQLRYNKFLMKLYLQVIDAFRFGFGIKRTEWVEEKMRARVMRTQEEFGAFGLGKMFGMTPKTVQVEEVSDVLKYQGNKMVNIPPFNFLPDPAYVLGEFQKGEFVAFEEETSLNEAKMKEALGYYHGVDHIPAINKSIVDNRDRHFFRGTDSTKKELFSGAAGTKQVILSEIQFTIIPKQWTKNLEFDFGDEDFPIKMIGVIANDQKLIRLERSGYLHNQYGFDIIEYSPDVNSFYNPGLSETIFELQNLMTWLLNTHVINVRKAIGNRFIVDENFINMTDLKENKTLIRTKGIAGNFDNVLKQLNISDITKNHIGDIDAIHSILQVITGVNENALGQFSSGRRSATEARNVSIGAAARLKMHAQLFWMQGYLQQGEQMLANTRQWRTKEVWDMIQGANAAKYPFEKVIYTRPEQIAGGYDFLPFDATLPSEKGFQGDFFKELISGMISNPVAAQAFQLDVVKMLEWVAQLYGVKNISDFRMVQQQMGVPQQVAVVPDEQAAVAVEQGAQAVEGPEALLAALSQNE